MRTLAIARPCHFPAHLVWLAQSVLAIAFGVMGLSAALMPMPALVQQMPWAAEMAPVFVRLIGLAQVAAAVSLIAPAATGVAKALVPIAAGAPAVMMGVALLVSLLRGDCDAMPTVVGLGLRAAFVAWARAGAISRNRASD